MLVHVADTWTRGNNRLQDDYELQLIVQPMIKEIFKEEEHIYEIQYENPDFYKTYWTGKNE